MPSVPELRRVSRQLVRELGMLRPQSPSGVSNAQCHALIELGERGRLTVAELAQALLLDKSTASRTVSALLRLGLVRVAADPGDKRSKPLELTARGRDHLARIHAAADAQVASALDSLSAAERQAVLTGLSLYDAALRRGRLRARCTIRRIRRADDAAVAEIIRRTTTEFAATGAGHSIHDPEVARMSAAYRGPRAAYWVVEADGRILGGGGIAPLAGGDPHTAELRKMYFAPEARGLGVGRQLAEGILAFARTAGYRRVYLETLERMQRARKLYEALGFQRAGKPLGHTGHFGCDAWYVLELAAAPQVRRAPAGAAVRSASSAARAARTAASSGTRSR